MTYKHKKRLKKLLQIKQVIIQLVTYLIPYISNKTMSY